MRSQIERSRRRSSLDGVDPSLGRLGSVPTHPQLDPTFLQSVGPVLSSLKDAVDDVASLIVLSDADGRLIQVLPTEPSAASMFDDVGADPGASANETHIGTNAVGIAVQEGKPTLVAGRDHYQEGFECIGCVAAPTRDPIARRVIGSIAVARRRDTPILASDVSALLPVVRDAALRIEQLLLDQATVADRLVLDAIKKLGGMTRRTAIGLSRSLMIANDPGARLLPLLDQAMLWERVHDQTRDGSAATVQTFIGDDPEPVDVRCTPVRYGDETVGVLMDFGSVDVKRVGRAVSRGTHYATPERSTTSIGTSREAAVIQSHLATAAVSDTPAVIVGEPGVGKEHAARMLMADRFPGCEVVTVRCSDRDEVATLLAGAEIEAPTALIHIELLSDCDADRLRTLIRRAEHPERLVATMTVFTDEPAKDLLADEFIRIRIPGLRYRRDDIAPLARQFASDSHGNIRRFTPEAMQVLQRYPWPGNVRELRGVVTRAAAGCVGNIDLDALPAEVRRLATRRRLTPLEQAEADAILSALRACDGNKAQASNVLEISRSRLYRKMRTYGLVGAVLN
ncbi:hypothetical protein BayCH28_25895 [Mycolicibacterium sp. CH28]|uniref:helix-turn-helix domain-containing protein n=1 Tax=Mycolicibacterium sp. CH28 TaxID=2512237 RepID=UPI001080351F|nr:helix-turn-helix domain-containing protein [Mycolicibacterium sp. CH28]TGD84343.1 hypothetical protein BayCH28_25895 [Mycolicibacterium sp. CH28]